MARARGKGLDYQGARGRKSGKKVARSYQALARLSGPKCAALRALHLSCEHRELCLRVLAAEHNP